jgi:hypothetical protein
MNRPRITANELRIGSWIYIPQTKTNEQIGVIEENGRFTTKDYKSSYSSIECLEPIPLTEEWLLKFGFMEFKGGISLDNEEFTLTYTHKNTDKTILLEVTREDEWGRHQYTCIVLNHIKYVHQLQNLYFALTGKELEMK